MAESDGTHRRFYCREWVFERIQTCLKRRKLHEDVKTKGAFVVGGPGSGKTSVLLEIVSPTAKEGPQVELCKKVIAHHFCEAQNSASVSVSEFIRSLGKQLAQAKPLEAYRHKFNDPNIQGYLKADECTRNPDLAFKEGILLPLNSLPPPEDVYLVVIDAIDEAYLHSFDSRIPCEGRTITELVANHHDLFPPWLFLAVSARKQSKTVTKMFTGFRKLTLDDLRKTQVVKDVQHYILNRLDDQPQLRKHLTRETAEVFNQLHIKSNGCIMYLERVLDGVINEFFSLGETHEIPGTLNGLYLWLCNRLYTQEQFEQIKEVLNVILASQKPLQETELFEALWTRNTSLTSEQFQELLNAMAHIVKDINGAKRIFHLSFAEWLLDVKYCTAKYLCNPSEGHAMLALRCTQVAERQHAVDRAVDVQDFAFHLSRASFRDNVSQALWLLWSGVPVRDVLQGTDIPKQEALQILVDAGADVSHLEAKRSSATFAQETEESVVALLKGGASVDRVDSTGRTPLCNASFNGNTDIVRLLLKHGANVNFSDPAGQSPLMFAARQGHGGIVYLLVNCGASVNHCADDGCTALRSAASGGHTDVVSVLLNHGAKVDLADDDQRTALRGASWGGHGDVVEQLLQHGAKPNLADKEGRTALIAAAYMGHKKIVQLLLDHGADINHADSDGRTALAVAVLCVMASENHDAVVKLLVDRRADLDRPDHDGLTPLCMACLEGHFNVAMNLVAGGADTGHWDRHGRTPLFAAAANGHKDIVELLLNKKEDAKAPLRSGWMSPKFSMFRADHNGWTALLVAAFQGHAGVVEALLKARVRVDVSDVEGRTALMLAAQEGHINVLAALLDSGASIDQATPGGRTALFLAALGRHDACVKLLVERGADVNHCDKLGQPPLFVVAMDGDKNMVVVLLDLGASVDCTDAEFRTPLQAVAWKGSYEVVELLLHRGANVNHADEQGRTALMSAAWQGHSSLIQLMIKKGARVEKMSEEGATALSVASQEGHEEAVQILLEHEANMNHADKLGRTPMQVASEAGHTKIMKVLEAFSVMRLNDTNFTSTLKRKLSATQSDTSSASNGSCERKQRSDSVSSSSSSESVPISSLELLPSGASHPASPRMLGERLGEHFEERRYSASFRDVHTVEPFKEHWNAACPPYSSQDSQGEPPPYSEKPSEGSLSIDSGDVTAGASSHQSKHKQTSMLHKLRLSKMRSMFSSSASHGHDKGSKAASKPAKSPGERRRLFTGMKRFNTSASQHDDGQHSPQDSNHSGSSETRI